MQNEKSERNEKMFAMYQQGKSCNEIAEIFSMSRGNAHHIIRRIQTKHARINHGAAQMKDKPIREAKIEDLLMANNASTKLRIGLVMNGGYEIVDDILQLTEWELMRCPGLSVRTISELKGVLQKYDLHLKGDTNQ